MRKQNKRTKRSKKKKKPKGLVPEVQYLSKRNSSKRREKPDGKKEYNNFSYILIL